MRRAFVAGTLALGGLAACQTITEEMPVRSTPVSNNPVPVVVVPIPIPVAASPAPQPTTPEPAPNNPNPRPTPTPNNNNNDFIPNNNSPVTKLGAKVYFLECNDAMVPGSEHATEAQVGCRIHFDCTPKDSSNAPTRSRGTPSWSFNNPSLIKVGKTQDYTPTVTAVKSGTLVAWAEVDGVRSNDVRINIR